MSQIRATTISDAAGTGPIALTGQSAAKAWVNFSPSGSSISDAFNVSSLTDNATGDFSHNFSSSMANSTYSISGDVGHTGSTTNGTLFCRLRQNTDMATSSVRVNIGYVTASSAAFVDYTMAVNAIHGDLA